MTPDKDFLRVIDQTPLVSIDLVCRNTQGQVLLGKRLNRPARDYWFVPGGRIRKNERLADALARISAHEIGNALSLDEGKLLGAFEHLYPDNYANAANISTHYVVLAYEFVLGNELPPPDNQHDAFQWWDIDALLGHTQVHANTQAYFRR